MVVVPRADTVLPDLSTLAPEVEKFAEDVEVVTEAVVPGYFDLELGFSTEAFYFAELVNTSLATVYHFTITGSLFDESGQLWSSDLLTPEYIIFPGETIVISEFLFNESVSSEAAVVETVIEPRFARTVTAKEAGAFVAENVSFQVKSFGEYEVTGELTNPFDITVETFIAYSWCVDSDGQLHGVYPEYFFPDEGGSLEPDQTVELSLSVYVVQGVVIDRCEISIARTAF